MRTIKSGLLGLILLVVAASALFLTCDVGLGNSVDTKPPTVTITYPPVQSIIKNTFTMAGAASDDTSLASVSVGVVNTVTAATYGPYAATIDATKSSWSLVVNNHTGSGYEIRDGTYEMTVTAVDGAGRKSVATTTYEIDNTPPVVVIERPGTNGPLASVAPEVYGTELKITGSINDDHAIDKLVFTAYDTAGNVVGSPITQTNISGVAMDITLAKSYKAPATSEEVALNAAYNALYNNPDANGTQDYYCTITASDSAREYNPPAAVASADNTRGNVNSVYYVYDSIYSSIFAATGYGVTMKDLTAMFNGSYADTAKSAAVLNALAAKARPAATCSTASGTFSLNPMNSPTFTVQGYDPLGSGSDITLAKNQKANSTDLTVIVHTGRDAIPLSKDSLKVMLVPCNASAVETGTGTPLLKSLADCGGDATAIADRDKQITKSGTDYLIQVTVKGDANSYYRVEVSGEDQSGNDVDNYGKMYGFMVVTNGLPPTIVVLTPTLNSYAAATVASHSITFSGTIDSENGTPELMLTGYSETKVNGTRYTVVDNAAFDKDNPATYVPITLTPSGTANRWNWSYTIDTLHNLSDANAKSVTATAVGNGEDLYTYNMILYAINKTNSPAQVTHVFFVDSAPPTAELVSVTPTTTASPPPYVVNGIVSAVLRFADDDRITTATYQLGSDPVQTIPTLNGYTIPNIDTRNYDDVSGMGKLPLEIKLTDRAGLTSTYRTDLDAVPAWLVNIDQSLDKPKLTVNYANTSVTTEAGINATTNLYGRDGYTAINGTVSDDDGIDSVVVTIDGADHAATVTGSTYSYNLSTLTPGYHDVRITAKDNALGETTSTPTFKIAYDTDLPTISITNPDGQFQKTALHLTGARSDGSGILSFTCMNGSTPVAITPDAGNDWHIDIPKPGASGQTTLTFAAKDTYGRTATKEFTYKYDLDAPTITVTTTLNAQPATNYFNQNYALTIKGEAAEAVSANPQSGLAGIEYTVVSGLSATLPGTPDWKPATGSATWAANVDITNSGTYPDGPYTVFVRSIDLMDNASSPVAYNVTGDRIAPTLTETKINTTDTKYVPATFDLGGEASDGGSGIASLTYSLNSGAPVDITASISALATWTLNQASLPDGTYSYVVTAKDKAGIVSNVTRKVMIDNTKPTCSITSPAIDGEYIKSDSFNFKGVAEDTGSGVASINLTINGVATVISPVKNWSSIQDLTALPEDTICTAELKVVDTAGNENLPVSRTFKVDRYDPRSTITVGAPASSIDDASVSYRKAPFSISGICDDATGNPGKLAASAVLTCSKDGGASTLIASSILSDGKPFTTGGIATGAWSYDQAVDTTATHANDGLYVYTLTVTDISGRVATATKTVRVDTTAPTVAVTAPVASESIATADATYTFQGTASDLGSGIDASTLSGMLDGTTAVPLNLSGASWTAASVALGSEGTKSFVVNCKDKLGNAITPITVNFYYDLNKPELYETKVGTTTLVTKEAFYFEGTCLDTNQMKEVDISATRQGVPAATKTWKWDPIDRHEKNTSETWKQDITIDSLKDGLGESNGIYTFTLVATDVAGKTTTIQRTVIVDTKAPTLGVPTVTTGTWLKNAVQTVSGSVEDNANGSGLASVEYAIVTDGLLDTESWYSMTVTGTTYSGAISFPDGTNSVIYIRATDRANNTQITVASGAVWVDTQNPGLTIDSPTSVVTLNGTKPLTVDVSGTDAAPGSGIAGFAVSAHADMSSPIASASYSSPYAAAKTASLSVPAASIAALPDGSQKLYVQTTDAAGRASTPTVVTVLIDTKVPTGKVTSHGASATVNKTIGFSGTASDENGLPTAAVTSIQVWKGHGGTADPAANDIGWETVTAAQQSAMSVSGSYSWEVTKFDTTKYASADYDARSDLTGFQLCVRVLVIDNAGNTGYINQTFTVDQDTDRPTIKMSNVNPDGTTTLKLSGVVYGSISDDDGISLLEISKTGTFSDGTDDDVAVSGGTWSYDAGGADGEKTLYFRVTDSEGGVFTTNAANDDNTLVEPKIQYGSNFYSSSVSYRVDTIAPEVSSTNPVVIDRTSALDFADAIPISTNLPLGGGVGGLYSQFRLRVLAKDANGIASVVATIPGIGSVSLVANGADATETTFTRFDSDADTSTVGVYEPTDISGLGDGAITISIVVTDKSGLTTTLNRTVLIDNHGPSITHSSPRNNNTADVVNGDAVIKGASADPSPGVGMKSLMYQTGLTADRAPGSALWKPVGGALFSWEIDYKAKTGVGDETGVDGNKIDAYAGQAVSLDVLTDTFTLSSHGYVTGTVVYFGGGGTLPTVGGSPMSVTDAYYVIRLDDNTFKVASSAANASAGTAIDLAGSYTNELSVSKYSKDTDNNGLWELPIILRAEDNAGNVTIEDYSTYIVQVDPTGDKPKVSIVYPSEGQTLGGIIRIFGTATDDDAVKEVYMQIDANGDGKYTSDDDKFGTSLIDWYNGGTGQLVSGTASWNETINESKEFNPTSGGTRTIHFRVRAKDINDPGVWGAWSDSRTIVIDSNVPKIGSSSPLRLVQYTDGTFTTIKASKPYVDDMYIKGTWYLVGSIEDESGINSVTISNSLSGNLTTSDGTSGAWFTAKDYSSGTMHGYEMRIPLTSSGSGKYTITIDTTDKSTPMGSNQRTLTIKYDNAAPELAAYTIDSIVQSNMVYTISSNLTEGDSGLDKIAFYFERNVSDDSKDRLYNVMEPRAGGANLTYRNTLTTIDGLPCLSLSTYTFAGDGRSLTSAALASSNTNVRVGGLAYVGGVFRRIDSITQTASSGTITWADTATDTGSAAIAYAMVVDNTTQESVVYKADNVTIDHIKNDDGDGMPESIVKTGATYAWDATFNSKNIPDGPIELHIVAFDNAGNYAEKTVTTSVQNNRPKIASVILGTDLNGDGDTGETGETLTYSALDGSNNPQSEVTIGSSSFIAKGLTSVKPTIIGGNGKLQYTLKVGANTITTLTQIRADESSAVSEVDITEAQLKATTIGEGAKNFVFKIWDSTEETTPGANDATSSQYAILTAPLTVNVVDGKPPKAVIKPFFWRGKGDGYNSLYKGLSTNGHIEIPDATANPAVSGKITVRGSATDNQRIAAIYAHIDGMMTADTCPTPMKGITDAPATYPSSTTFAGSTDEYVLVATFINGVWETIDHFSDQGWDFTASTTSLTQDGHTVSWVLDWDTSMITNVADANRNIKIVCVDKALAPSELATPEKDAEISESAMVSGESYVVSVAETGSPTVPLTSVGASSNEVGNFFVATGAGNGNGKVQRYSHKPIYKVDVVPYISVVTTTLSQYYKNAPSVFNRTALGHYPVYAGSTHANTVDTAGETISLTGFNFNGTSTGVYLNGTTSLLSIATDTSGTPAGTAKTKIKATIGLDSAAGMVSGPLTVTVNSQTSRNNDASTAKKAYNLLPNGINNNLLNDDVYLDVWQFTEAGWSKGGGINNPNMKVSPTGQLGFSFGHSVVYFSMPGKKYNDTTYYSQTAFQKNYGWFTENDFTFDAQGNTYGAALCPDTSANPGYSANFTWYSRMAQRAIGNMGLDDNYQSVKDGSTYYNFRLANTSQNIDSDGDGANDDGVTDIFRVKSPSIATTMQDPTAAASASNLVRVYLAYYDDLTQEVRFRYGTVGANPGDVSFSMDDVAKQNGTNNRNYFTGFNGPDVPAAYYQVVSTAGFYNRSGGRTTATSVLPGEFVALGVYRASATKDVAIIAWYDSTNRQLYWSYNDDPMNLNTQTSRDQWQQHARVVDPTVSTGQNVKLAIDGDGGIHIVYYALAGGDLKYAYLENYQDTDADIATVDSYLSVGTNCTIDVAKKDGHQVPYIGYYMGANSGTSACLKVARRVNFNSNAAADFDGADSDDCYTGNWEISIVPEKQTIVPADSLVSVGVCRDATSGDQKVISTATYTKATGETNSFPLSESSIVGGNGSMNPAIGYATKAGVLKMAQKRD